MPISKASRITTGETPDGAEIVADIEARIAELILSTQDNTRVVEKPLMMNIIAQMGSAEDISDQNADHDLQYGNPRIPRRLYRDTENAKLGRRLRRNQQIFRHRSRLGTPRAVPAADALLFGGIPFLFWFGPLFGNLFGIFLICYFIVWFAVPAARSARQKLEMNGERSPLSPSARSPPQPAATNPIQAKPIVAEAPCRSSGDRADPAERSSPGSSLPGSSWAPAP